MSPGWLPASVWATSPKSAPGWRSPSAIRSASKTSVVRMCDASCQPTILRLFCARTSYVPAGEVVPAITAIGAWVLLVPAT